MRKEPDLVTRYVEQHRNCECLQYRQVILIQEECQWFGRLDRDVWQSSHICWIWLKGEPLRICRLKMVKIAVWYDHWKPLLLVGKKAKTVGGGVTRVYRATSAKEIEADLGPSRDYFFSFRQRTLIFIKYLLYIIII